jgi:hypothetical protein
VGWIADWADEEADRWEHKKDWLHLYLYAASPEV